MNQPSESGTSIMRSRLFGLCCCVLALVGVPMLGGASLSACGGDTPTADGTTGGGGDHTAGGEGQGGGGGGGGGAGPTGPVAPPPGDLEDGLDTPDAGTAAPPQAAPDAGGAAAETDTGWGSAETDTGTPLPPRRPMNSSARSSYRDGLAASRAGNDAAARQAFEATLSADPSAFKAAYALGVISDRAGNETRALEYYRQSLRLQADYERAAEGVIAVYIRRAAVPDALAFIEPLARQWVRNLALQALYAEVLVAADRPDDAITAARAALRRDERFVPAMIALVKASLKRQPPRTELAESVLDQALAIDENNAEAHFIKGRMQQTANRLGEALAEYRKAVDLRPDYVEARVALGLQFIASGNYDEAQQSFETAARLLPGSVEIALNLADAYRSSKQWTKAKATFDRALQMRERLPQAHFNLGLMYMAAGDQFPGLDKMTSLQRATQEINLYRDQMGPALPRTDTSTDLLADIAKQIEREQKRLDREKVRLEREAAKKVRDAARAAAAPPAEEGADAGAAAPATP